tara:strand:- start:10205 stop:10741 length:537 start_codon:yes stop_codon:yes gene_type:complete
MASFNRVMIMGNLTRDPEVRYTPKGTAVTDIGLAVNRYFSGDGGERQEETTFVDVTLWGRTAEVAGQYLQKGRPVFIEGRLQMDTWQDKATGQNRSRLKVVGESMQLIGGKSDGGGGGGGNYQQGGGGGNYAPPQEKSYGDGGNDYSSKPESPQPPSGGGGGGGGPLDVGEEDDEIPF